MVFAVCIINETYELLTIAPNKMNQHLLKKQADLIKELEQLPRQRKTSNYRRRGVEILIELQQINRQIKTQQ